MMIDSQVNLDLMHFVETNILPRYVAFGPSHGLAHVKRVIEHSLQLAKKIGVDVNMAYYISS